MPGTSIKDLEQHLEAHKVDEAAVKDNKSLDPLIGKTIHVDTKGNVEFNLDPDKPTVYLCGGFYGNWNQAVKDAIGDVANVIDPRDWRTDKPEPENIYVSRDIDAINESDIVYAFRQKKNTGIGMAHEIGYACGEGSYIIFYGKYESSDMERYWGFARQMADFVATDFEDSINHLKMVVEHWHEERSGTDSSSEVESAGGRHLTTLESAGLALGGEISDIPDRSPITGHSESIGLPIPVLDKASEG